MCVCVDTRSWTRVHKRWNGTCHTMIRAQTIQSPRTCATQTAKHMSGSLTCFRVFQTILFRTDKSSPRWGTIHFDFLGSRTSFSLVQAQFIPIHQYALEDSQTMIETRVGYLFTENNAERVCLPVSIRRWCVCPCVHKRVCGLQWRCGWNVFARELSRRIWSRVQVLLSAVLLCIAFHCRASKMAFSNLHLTMAAFSTRYASSPVATVFLQLNKTLQAAPTEDFALFSSASTRLSSTPRWADRSCSSRELVMWRATWIRCSLVKARVFCKRTGDNLRDNSPVCEMLPKRTPCCSKSL